AEAVQDAGINVQDVERTLRARLDTHFLATYHRIAAETTKRWTFEQEIKRPYFHTEELDEAQISVWRKYLDFEEAEGDYQRTAFLYERCLVTLAQHVEFWLRYARWMLAQPGKDEEVRMIYERASCIYAPIAEPIVRLQYALFEEMSGRIDVAAAVHEAILVNTPAQIDVINSWANLERRHDGLEAAINVMKQQIDSQEIDIQTKGALVANWALLLWKHKGSADEARRVFQKNQQYFLDVRSFWMQWLSFEISLPASINSEDKQYVRINQIHEDIINKSRLPVTDVKEMTHVYMQYLLDRGKPEAAKEYMMLDKDVNG
ncbi:hypothetical protein LTS18_001502, partial [Coniosporium uncinatum]